MTDLSSLVNRERGVNTLLLGPTFHETTTEGHHSLLTPDDLSTTHMLFITYRKSPDSVITKWRGQTGDGPHQIGVISMGEQIRESHVQTQQSLKMIDSVWVEAIQSPGDLTALGISCNNYIDQYDQDEGPLVVCFDSVTALLQYVDEKTAYRFLHIVTKRFQAVNAVTHFHIDSDAHDPQTVAKFKSLFDAVIEVSDGKLTVYKG